MKVIDNHKLTCRAIIRRADCVTLKMEINYFTLTIIGVLMVTLVVWLVIRNRKDEKAFEKDEIDSSAIESHDPVKD
jgi:hypothetical protein